MAGKVRSPWERPPKKPKVGAGRAALAKRAKARGAARKGTARKGTRGGERKRAAAVRRGLSRGRRRGGPGKHFGPVRGAANGLMRFYGLFEQKFLIRQRLRTILVMLAAIWALWVFGIGDAGVFRLLHTKQQNARLDVQIEELRTQETALRDEVRALTSERDVSTLERVAREEHALVQDGEVLVRFYEEAED